MTGEVGTTIVWMDQTEKGKKLALELYHADDPDHSGHQTPTKKEMI
jgi:hypothetical protein